MAHSLVIKIKMDNVIKFLLEFLSHINWLNNELLLLMNKYNLKHISSFIAEWMLSSRHTFT